MKYVGSMNISLQQVQAFLAVVEQGNMTKAAECMNVTQPLISQRICTLEDDLGFQLFIRDKKRLEVTPAGNCLYERWKNVIEDMEKAVEDARKIVNIKSSEIRFGFPFSVRPEKLLQFVPQLRHYAPNLVVQVENSNYLREHLLNGVFDVIYLSNYEPLETSSDILYFTVKVKKFITIMRKDHPLASLKKLEWSDLRDTVIFFQPPSITGSYEKKINEMCRKSGFSPHIVNCSNLFNAELNMALGKGVVIGAQQSVNLDSDDFIYYEMDGTDTPIVTACLANADPKVVTFADHAAKVIRDFI